MVAGGTLRYDPFYGSPSALLFDPITEKWVKIPSMNNGRWYPTVLTLGSGRILHCLDRIKMASSTDNQKFILLHFQMVGTLFQ